jgi:hypothetical protein
MGYIQFRIALGQNLPQRRIGGLKERVIIDQEYQAMSEEIKARNTVKKPNTSCYKVQERTINETVNGSVLATYRCKAGACFYQSLL